VLGNHDGGQSIYKLGLMNSVCNKQHSTDSNWPPDMREGWCVGLETNTAWHVFIVSIY